MMRLATHALVVAIALALGACASSKPEAPAANAAVQSAKALEIRAARAFVQGDLERALKDFDTAAAVYASLALTDAYAQAQLNSARVLADSGQAAQAQARVLAVLAWPEPLSPSVRTTAHGRAAALALQAGDFPQTAIQLASAQAVCGKTCEQSGALAVLAARLHLAQGNAALALAAAQQALAWSPKAESTGAKENAAQSQAQAGHANALRVRAQAYAGLQNHRAALADAQAALALDQALGFAARVALDLQLMAAAQQALGLADAAKRSATLAEQSLAAARSLKGKE